MTSVFSWQKSVSLCPASFCTPMPNLPVTPDISWLLAFASPSPIIKKKHLSEVLVIEDLHRTIQLQLLHISGWDIYLDYCDTEWFDLEMNRDHSVVFEVPSKCCILDSFVDYDSNPLYSIEGYSPLLAYSQGKQERWISTSWEWALCGVLLFQQEKWVCGGDTVLRLVSEGCLLAAGSVWTRGLRSVRLVCLQ